MSHNLGLMIESTVAVLLMITIGYCIVLNRRLRRLKSDELSLKKTITELLTATGSAERAIGTLKQTVRECNENLVEKLRSAERVSTELGRQLTAAEELLKRPARLEAAAQQAAPPRDAKAMLAAAQAFAARVSGAAA